MSDDLHIRTIFALLTVERAGTMGYSCHDQFTPPSRAAQFFIFEALIHLPCPSMNTALNPPEWSLRTEAYSLGPHAAHTLELMGVSGPPGVSV